MDHRPITAKVFTVSGRGPVARSWGPRLFTLRLCCLHCLHYGGIAVQHLHTLDDMSSDEAAAKADARTAVLSVFERYMKLAEQRRAKGLTDVRPFRAIDFVI